MFFGEFLMSGDVSCPKESKPTFKRSFVSVQGVVSAHICLAEPLLPFCQQALEFCREHCFQYHGSFHQLGSDKNAPLTMVTDERCIPITNASSGYSDFAEV